MPHRCPLYISKNHSWGPYDPFLLPLESPSIPLKSHPGTPKFPSGE